MQRAFSNSFLPFWRANRAGLSSGWLTVLFFVLMVIVFSRRPQDILHAQFYAEDGARWFAQAYNFGWLHSLSIPDSGYLQILPRLPAGLALLLPFKWGPLTMNLTGAALQVLPAAVLVSSRCERWGPFSARAAMAAMYIANPNAPEIHVNITNAQWHYALLEVFLAFAPTPRSWFGKGVILLVFLVGAVSGPFGVVLLPILLVFWYVERRGWTLVLIAMLAMGTVVQIRTFSSVANISPSDSTLKLNRIGVERVPLGASPALLVRIIGDHVVLDSLLGASGPRLLDHVPMAVVLLLLFFGSATVILALRWAPLEFRLFAIFTLILFGASLKSPMISGAGTRWQLLFIDGGMRYYFLPSLVFLWAVVYCAWYAPSPLIRRLGTATMLIFVLGVARRWEYVTYPDLHYPAEPSRLSRAQKGDVVQIPIAPVPWSMLLVKR